MNVQWGTTSGVITVLLMIVFIGIWVWAWRRKHKPVFDRMAAIPMEDELGCSENGPDTQPGGTDHD